VAAVRCGRVRVGGPPVPLGRGAGSGSGYAVRAQLVRPDLADQDVKTLTKRLTPTLGVYVVMILLGLFLTIVAVFGYLALALFILIPFSAIRHRSSPA
jgi:hypothetical protein